MADMFVVFGGYFLWKMRTRKEGAANRQVTRSYGYPATRRRPMTILPEQREPEEWSRPMTIAVTAIGALLMFAFMWLTAAY